MLHESEVKIWIKILISIQPCFQLQNSDGVWLRLTKESIQKYCHKNNNSYNNSYNNNYSNNNSNNNSNNDDETASNDITAGWVLQYHQHYRKTYLFPVVEKNKENFYIKNIALNAKRHESDKRNQGALSFYILSFLYLTISFISISNS